MHRRRSPCARCRRLLQAEEGLVGRHPGRAADISTAPGKATSPARWIASRPVGEFRGRGSRDRPRCSGDPRLARGQHQAVAPPRQKPAATASIRSSPIRWSTQIDMASSDGRRAECRRGSAPPRAISAALAAIGVPHQGRQPRRGQPLGVVADEGVDAADGPAAAGTPRAERAP